jgi:hypothetical protein
MRKSPDSHDDKHSGFLRIVDVGESASSGFPFRLVATHMSALIENTKNPVERERVYRRAIEIFPGRIDEASKKEYEQGSNENNFISWYGLGEALCDQSRFEEGLRFMEEADARSPAWARDFACHIKESGAENSQGAEEDPQFRFWLNMDAEAIRHKVAARYARGK